MLVVRGYPRRGGALVLHCFSFTHMVYLEQRTR